MEESTTTQDAPVVPSEPTQPVAPATPTDAPQQEVEVPETPVVTPSESTPAPETTSEVEIEDEFEYPSYQIPQAQPLDFNNMPANEDGTIDPNMLAAAINQQNMLAEERAFQRAQQAFAEQQAETRGWDKAYEKYPELKSNKELRDLVHNARLGEVANMLSKTQDPQSVKLPTPGQMADRLFKHISTAKADGMKQANENTVIQQSAHLETASSKGSDSGEARTKAFQNINNPNKEVARQARSELLKSMLFPE